MRTSTGLSAAILVWAMQTVCAFAASVPVFSHDPVQEKAYFRHDVLPQLIPLALIAVLAVILITAAVHKTRRKPKHPSPSNSDAPHC